MSSLSSSSKRPVSTSDPATWHFVRVDIRDHLGDAVIDDPRDFLVVATAMRHAILAEKEQNSSLGQREYNMRLFVDQLNTIFRIPVPLMLHPRHGMGPDEEAHLILAFQLKNKQPPVNMFTKGLLDVSQQIAGNAHNTTSESYLKILTDCEHRLRKLEHQYGKSLVGVDDSTLNARHVSYKLERKLKQSKNNQRGRNEGRIDADATDSD